MYKGILTILLCLFVQLFSVYGQKDSIFFEEEDLSIYNNVVSVPTKRYCTSKVSGLSPSKLISFGFDYQGSSIYTAGADKLNGFSDETAKNNFNYGTRFAANFPFISNTKLLVNLGINWWSNNYSFENKADLKNPFIKTLNNNGLRTTGANLTVFKPFNEFWFTLAQCSFDFNGDFKTSQLPQLNQLKVSATIIIGKKPIDRRICGIGIARTYRAGELSLFPILLYNYTFPNKKWGIEALLPAKANIRYAINSRNLIFAGFELEGNSYRLNNLMAENTSQLPAAYNALELRRSEFRPRITYEFSLYKFFWISIQAGYRYNYKFNMDNGNFYRGADDKPYVTANSFSNSFYTSFSLNLVSP